MNATDEEFEAMYAPNTAKSPSPTSLAINGVSSHGVSELNKSQQSSDCQGNSDGSSSASAVTGIPFATVSHIPPTPTPTTNIIYIETSPPPS